MSRTGGSNRAPSTGRRSNYAVSEADDYLIEEDDWETVKKAELLELRLRTAVTKGDTLVDIARNNLVDDDAKLLISMLNEAETAARTRLRAAKTAQQAADRIRSELEAPAFQPWEPEPEEDPDELAYQEACKVVWPDDPYVPMTVNDDAASKNPFAVEAPPSYRFTPREERQWIGDRVGGGVARHASGRARLLFKAAMQRYNMRQKALIAAAAVANVEYEEGGRGCHHLLLQQNKLGSRGTAHVCSLIRSSEVLETVALACNPIGDTGAALLGRALQHTRVLKTLSIQDCGIGQKGVKHLSAGLAHNRSLTALYLFGNKAEDKGAMHLAGALRSCRLESLGLEKNGVRGLGCEALSLALAMESCSVRHLRMQHNPLGDDGVAALSQALLTNRSLTHLQLRDVGIGTRGIRALSEGVRKHEKLTRLGLEQNELTPSMTEELLRGMQAGKLQHLVLDMGHGGDCERTHTRDDLRRQMTLAFLGISKIRKKAAEEKEKGAKSYVGKLGVSNIYGGSAQAGDLDYAVSFGAGDGVREGEVTGFNYSTK